MTSSHDAGRRAHARRLVLASASPSRLRVLRFAGFAPEVVVSGVEEDGVDDLPAAEQVEALAARKAAAVARRVEGDALVIGCDSMLEVDGVARSKPGTADAALRGWQAMRGRAGVLHTGHCVIDTATGSRRTATTASTVHFGTPSDRELAAYVASGEPLEVAGGFTIEGKGAAFVERVDGDPSNVLGLSVPTLRRLLADLGVELVDLWV